MTWNQYAAQFKSCFCELAQGRPGWLVYLPSETVWAPTIEIAREIAADVGCEVHL